MSSPSEFEHHVVHPRYGRGPRLTGLDVEPTDDLGVYLHWHSPAGIRIPNTAVSASTQRQEPATISVTHYFDSRRVCRRCKRPFLFFAEEQRYWYEELEFPLEADCLDCADCRREERVLRGARARYEELVNQDPRPDQLTIELVESALVLVDAGVFSDKLLPRLRAHLKPLATQATEPHAAAARSLLERLQSTRSRDDA
jgi:hypothetical protein